MAHGADREGVRMRNTTEYFRKEPECSREHKDG